MHRDAVQTPPAGFGPELAYLRNEVEASDPVELLVRLYNKLVSVLRSAGEGLDTLDRDDPGPIPAAVEADFKRARDILSYLLATVNPEAGEVAERLTALYYFFLEKVLTAELERDSRHLAGILPSIETVRDGWAGLARRGTADADGRNS